MSNFYSVGIIGGGLTGLVIAKHLQEAGINYQLFERSESLGGRIKTIKKDGFLFDHGFHVYLPAGETNAFAFNEQDLNLRSFNQGALIYKNRKLYRLMNPLRHPFELPKTLFTSIATVKDKYLILKLVSDVLTRPISHQPTNETTNEFLHNYGFSKNFIEDFFRPFFGGVFLDRKLSPESGFFKYLFSRFARAGATLPANGIGSLTKQVASSLDNSKIQLKCKAIKISKNELKTENGEIKNFNKIIEANGLLKGQESFGTSCFYFEGPKFDTLGKSLMLISDPKSCINTLCSPSEVAPEYAPEGKRLLSVSSLDTNTTEGEVRAELVRLFPEHTHGMKHLETFRIPQALPAVIDTSEDRYGDFKIRASQTGAIESALKGAERIVKELQKSNADFSSPTV